MTDINNDFSGNFLKLLREHNSLSLGVVARSLGLSIDYLHSVESGLAFLTRNQAKEYIRVVQNHTITLPAKSYLIEGGNTLSGEITVNTSKNGAMGVLCASLLNRGVTILHGIPRIEEVKRMLEVFDSIGVVAEWVAGLSNTLRITSPEKLTLENINYESASRTRTIIMLIGSLIHRTSDSFLLPMPSGCNLGTRTVTPHITGLRELGVVIEDVHTELGEYFKITHSTLADRTILMREKGDTATENILIAAAGIPGKTIIRGGSTNYMVMEVIYFLRGLGVRIDLDDFGQLIVHGVSNISQDGYQYHNSEDPIESMTLITAGVITKSELTIKRCPRKYIEFELAWLQDMGLRCSVGEEYLSKNNNTSLIDVTIYPSQLRAVDLVIKPSTYPGINPDNAPFFVLLCTQAEGFSQYNDWMFNGRNKLFVEDLNKLGAHVEMVGDHSLRIHGPSTFKPFITTSPKALRPTIIIMLGMLAAKGSSVLIDTYQVSRGYQDLPNRLNTLGAVIVEKDSSTSVA